MDSKDTVILLTQTPRKDIFLKTPKFAISSYVALPLHGTDSKFRACKDIPLFWEWVRRRPN